MVDPTRRGFLAGAAAWGLTVATGGVARNLWDVDPDDLAAVMPDMRVPSVIAEDVAEILGAVDPARVRPPRFPTVGFAIEVQPHTVCMLHARPAQALRVRRLATIDAEAFTIDRFAIREHDDADLVDMFIGSGAVPARVFSLNGPEVQLLTDPVPVGGSVHLDVTNHSDEAAEFRAVLVGQA